jgi:hypothetical protein
MPFIVTTYVCASSQGQRTHSARTKMFDSCLLRESSNLNECMGGQTIHQNVLILPNVTQASPKVKVTNNNYLHCGLV